MEQARPPENTLHCPTCGQTLSQTPCIDPFSIALVCKQAHHFRIMPELLSMAESGNATEIQLSELGGRSNREIAMFWLSEPIARTALNEQLAEILIAIVDTRRMMRSLPFAYCPLCGKDLVTFEQEDIWVTGLRCLEGHTWSNRADDLTSTTKEIDLRILRPPTDSTIAQLIDGWLSHNPVLDPQLHDSVRLVLENSRFRSKRAT